MTGSWYRVVYISGCGFGTLSPRVYHTMPAGARKRVRVLALCDTQEGATEMFKRLPQVWTEDTWRSYGKEEA